MMHSGGFQEQQHEIYEYLKRSDCKANAWSAYDLVQVLIQAVQTIAQMQNVPEME